jgi:hypothetical protein
LRLVRDFGHSSFAITVIAPDRQDSEREGWADLWRRSEMQKRESWQSDRMDRTPPASPVVDRYW